MRVLSSLLLLVACVSCGNVTITLDAHVGRPVGRDAGNVSSAPQWASCAVGQTRCVGTKFQTCVQNGQEFTSVDEVDCSATSQACVASLGGCVTCAPGILSCSADRSHVVTCSADGSGFVPTEACDLPNGIACIGDHCGPLCEADDAIGTNVGCEYYAVDLDNAQLGVGMSAASSQYAVVVSNPDDTLSARVVIERNAAPAGEAPRIERIDSAVIPPLDLEVFRLDAREVDCSAPGTFNTGTGTCLSSQAYHIVSTIPVVAAQFNPLENGLQFSNDASLLVPVDSLSGDYSVMAWPQTLSSRPRELALNPGSPDDLRGFVTVVGTATGTHVRVVPRTDLLPGGPFTTRPLAGVPLDVTLGPFDVLNLETDQFEADLTGTRVLADRPVAVFAGSECSDVPNWFDINDRRCCCDHLEAQTFPRDTIGRAYVAMHTPRRTPVVHAAGAPVGVIAHEAEFFRVLAISPGTTHVRTNVPTDVEDPQSAPLVFDLAEGEFRTIRSYANFTLDGDRPVSVANFMSGQGNTGIPLNFPGGDPSFVPMPPVEQWRSRYVFLTPDKYAFDFVTIASAPGTVVQLDGDTLPTRDCTVERSDACENGPRVTCDASTFTVYQCQLSFPVISPDLPYPMNVLPGHQRDGVHTVSGSSTIGVVVSGFDLRVSYGYPAGTQLHPLL